MIENVQGDPISKDENHESGALPLEVSKTAPDRPYGDCYEASFKSAEELQENKFSVEADPTNEEFKNLYDRLGLTEEIAIVHGKAIPPDGLDQGRTISHAWVEVGGNVIESSNKQLQKHTAADYYETLKIEVMRRYSITEARELAQKHKVYGLWHEMH